MQGPRDIFSIWANVSEMAESIDQLPDTVYRWKLRSRIPEEHWNAVIAAAGKRGKTITASDILAANTPSKRRGWPRHKVRRVESRAS